MKVAGSINLLSYASDSYISSTHREWRSRRVRIVLADGSSGCGPEAFAHAVSLVLKSAPGTSVAVHTHNLFGLAKCVCSRRGFDPARE